MPVPICSCQLPPAAAVDVCALLTTEVPGVALHSSSALMEQTCSCSPRYIAYYSSTGPSLGTQEAQAGGEQQNHWSNGNGNRPFLQSLDWMHSPGVTIASPPYRSDRNARRTLAEYNALTVGTAIYLSQASFPAPMTPGKVQPFRRRVVLSGFSSSLPPCQPNQVPGHSDLPPDLAWPGAQAQIVYPVILRGNSSVPGQRAQNEQQVSQETAAPSQWQARCNKGRTS